MNAALGPPFPSGDESPAKSPAEQLAEGFGRHVEHWARRLACDETTVSLLRLAAVGVSRATSEGHVCLSLGRLMAEWSAADVTATATATAAAPSLGSLRHTLLTSGLVGTPNAPGALPLILDAGERLYLHRYFDYERRLAHRLMRAAAAKPAPVDATTRDLLNALFQSNTAALGGRTDWQKVAAALALRQRLIVVSGGPGTGKTSTVVNLLACLLAQDPDCRIALAAPTGKAAARMSEAVRLRAGHLPPALRERLPAESHTIHRLLGVTPGGFKHHAGNPLAIDALVIDEASMLDLALAVKLLEAVPETARIILLGDKDQLSAVESGAVFAELCADPSLGAACRQDLAALCGWPAGQIVPPAPDQPSALQDAVIWFTQNFRFAADSGIGRLAADINGARASEAIAWLRDGEDSRVRWLEDGGAAPGAAALQHLLRGYAPYFEAVQRDATDHATVVAAFGTFRVLCALREGARGMAAVNERVTRHVREQLQWDALPGAGARAMETGSPWYPGRPVMVLRNDPVQKLFNGDIGIALPDAAGELAVYFPDAAGGLRAIAPVRLPEHQTAFAMTVHKSQGSEFDEVLVLLPDKRSPVVTRELLYTAVTRARLRVAVCAGAEVLAAAIESRTQRESGLLARLREATPSAVIPGVQAPTDSASSR